MWLRRAMATVLGPTAINEKKFTTWSTKCKTLGLFWDTKSASVSVPAQTLAKASHRVHQLLSTKIATRTQMLRVSGSLRHVVSCFPPARVFIQTLQDAASRCPKYGQISLPTPVLEDLCWFTGVLQHPLRFNAIPVFDFAELYDPQYHVFVDASGSGLCTIEPSLKQYIRQRFTGDDLSNTSVNVREPRCAVLAAFHWGPVWFASNKTTRTHVQFHIDNVSAVAWPDHHNSRNKVAMMHNRLLSLAEFRYNLVFNAFHIAGKHNVMADAGSRAWNGDHTLTNKWTNMSSSSQALLEAPFDNLSDVWDQCCAKTPWQMLPQSRIPAIGASGVDSPTKWVGLGGSRLLQLLNGWHTSPHTAGPIDGMHAAAETTNPLSSLNSQASDGSTGDTKT
ncbi:hypothetical protein ON010_g4101 [Phytophthora cinnamomi]|nr:hypothetical protein ON010_g4101 [Phytophthora cinnamomi]